jgi:RNA polymerase sigma factor (sigma-70 family)
VTSVELRPGDTTQAGRLFEEHSERLYKYCLRRLESGSEAEDAVQTTFLYAHRALGRGVVPTSESAWLYAIAKNVCRWQRRTNRRRGSAATEIDLDTLPSPERGRDEDGLLMGLDDALAVIPERQRQALLLREWRGLSCPEIATQLEMTEPATHALLTRARRSLLSALTTATRRPALGLDFGSLLAQLRSLLLGSSTKVAVTVVAVASVGVGGISVERALTEHHSAPGAPAVGRDDLGARSPGTVTGPFPAFLGRRLAGRTSKGAQALPAPAAQPTAGAPAGGAQGDPLPPTTVPGADGGSTTTNAPSPGVTTPAQESPLGELSPDPSLDPIPLPDPVLPIDLAPPELPLPPLPPPPDLPSGELPIPQPPGVSSTLDVGGALLP